jgi:hypothetical protein
VSSNSLPVIDSRFLADLSSRLFHSNNSLLNALWEGPVLRGAPVSRRRPVHSSAMQLGMTPSLLSFFEAPLLTMSSSHHFASNSCRPTRASRTHLFEQRVEVQGPDLVFLPYACRLGRIIRNWPSCATPSTPLINPVYPREHFKQGRKGVPRLDAILARCLY